MGQGGSSNTQRTSPRISRRAVAVNGVKHTCGIAGCSGCHPGRPAGVTRSAPSRPPNKRSSGHGSEGNGDGDADGDSGRYSGGGGGGGSSSSSRKSTLALLVQLVSSNSVGMMFLGLGLCFAGQGIGKGLSDVGKGLGDIGTGIQAGMQGLGEKSFAP